MSVSFVEMSSQVTLGVLLGTRPYISLSKSSTISGLLFDYQVLAFFTGFPFFKINALGKSGNGFALDSS
jgi:hypothetical protein